MTSAPLRKSEKLADPTWYRIEYSLAAQRFHAAGTPEDAATKQDEETFVGAPGELTKDEVNKLKDEVNKLTGQRSSASVPDDDGFAKAELEALKLIRVTADVLAEMGWRWAGRQPSWYVSWSERVPASFGRLVRRLRRKPRRRSIIGDWPLAKFLDRTVEPAAVLLVWSARIERGTEGDSLGRYLTELAAVQEAEARIEQGSEGDSLGRYLTELAAVQEAEARPFTTLRRDRRTFSRRRLARAIPHRARRRTEAQALLVAKIPRLGRRQPLPAARRTELSRSIQPSLPFLTACAKEEGQQGSQRGAQCAGGEVSRALPLRPSASPSHRGGWVGIAGSRPRRPPRVRPA